MGLGMNEVITLREGYSYETNGCVKANCTISLVKHEKGNIIVDTGLPCDKDILCNAILKNKVRPEDIDLVIATHGHSDHVGNLNVFADDCLLIVGHDVSKGDTFISNQLREGKSFVLTESISVLSTPGHTNNDVSVLVRNTSLGTVALVGDIFECAEDIYDDILWKKNSFSVEMQQRSRMSLISICDYIVPGHGPLFKVTDELRRQLSLNQAMTAINKTNK